MYAPVAQDFWGRASNESTGENWSVPAPFVDWQIMSIWWGLGKMKDFGADGLIGTRFLCCVDIAMECCYGQLRSGVIIQYPPRERAQITTLITALE